MTAGSPVKINSEHFKDWMTAILSVTKTDTLLQGMDGCNQSDENNNNNNNNNKKLKKYKKYLRKGI